MGLKDSWKDVGKGIAGTGKSFGKAFIKTMKKGYNKVGEWAATEKEEEKKEEAVETEVVEAEVVEEEKKEETVETEVAEAEVVEADPE